MPQIPSGFGQNRGILFFAEDNSHSVLNFTHKLLAWRKEHPTLRLGSIGFLSISEEVIAFERCYQDSKHLCAFNFSANPQRLFLPPHEQSDFFAHRTESNDTLLEMAGFSLFLAEATSQPEFSIISRALIPTI